MTRWSKYGLHDHTFADSTVSHSTPDFNDVAACVGTLNAGKIEGAACPIDIVALFGILANAGVDVSVVDSRCTHSDEDLIGTSDGNRYIVAYNELIETTMTGQHRCTHRPIMPKISCDDAPPPD